MESPCVGLVERKEGEERGKQRKGKAERKGEREKGLKRKGAGKKDKWKLVLVLNTFYRTVGNFRRRKLS